VRGRGNESGKVVAGIVATTAFVRWRSDARRALVHEPGSNIEGASNFGRKRQSWRRLVVASQHRGESPRRPGGVFCRRECFRKLVVLLLSSTGDDSDHH
jgi:hypothetical protein